MKKLSIAAVALLTTTASANAHEGEHAMTVMQALQHMLTEPYHLAMIVAAIGFGAFMVYSTRKRA